MPKRAKTQKSPETFTCTMMGEKECTLKVKLLSEHATVPKRQTDGSAGYDLHASEKTDVFPQSKAMVSTGIAVQIPTGHYGRIAPRSSIAWKKYVDVGGGVIDQDYRGEVQVLLYNHSGSIFHIKSGDRIAQLIIEKISYPEVEVVESLDDTERGSGGFGSTGK